MLLLESQLNWWSTKFVQDWPTYILHIYHICTHTARMLMYVEIYTDFSRSHNCLTSCTTTFTTTFTKLTFLNTHRFLIPYIMKHITTINIVTPFFFQDLKISSFLDLRILIHLDFLLPLGCCLVSCRISFKKKNVLMYSYPMDSVFDFLIHIIC